jgi:hypothetical protein
MSDIACGAESRLLIQPPVYVWRSLQPDVIFTGILRRRGYASGRLNVAEAEFMKKPAF